MTTFLIVQLKCFLEGNSRVDAKFKDDLLNGGLAQSGAITRFVTKISFLFCFNIFHKMHSNIRGFVIVHTSFTKL